MPWIKIIIILITIPSILTSCSHEKESCSNIGKLANVQECLFTQIIKEGELNIVRHATTNLDTTKYIPASNKILHDTIKISYKQRGNVEKTKLKHLETNAIVTKTKNSNSIEKKKNNGCVSLKHQPKNRKLQNFLIYLLLGIAAGLTLLTINKLRK